MISILAAHTEAFADYYSHQPEHENLDNVTASDVYLGRDNTILKQLKGIKLNTLQARRLQHFKQVA
jgi:hypothetical protein